MIWSVLVTLTAVVAGAVAGISGFGIGSLLTPAFALHYEAKLAVAIVAVPHLVATAVRFVTIREHLDRKIFLNFGILSAAGGLTGALLHAKANSPGLGITFGCLLIFAGISGLTNLTQRMRFGRTASWIAGLLSGFFGGLVGNQGGIRSAALQGFEIRKEALVATATAVALVVDAARMPVYFSVEGASILGAWPMLAATVGGALLGTFWGVRLLRRIPEKLFRRLLNALILGLGIYMLVQGAAS